MEAQGKLTPPPPLRLNRAPPEPVQWNEEAMDSAPGRPESDAELVARFKGGDESAYDGLVVEA